MGSDNLFAKRRKERQARKAEYKQTCTNSYLIVSEGKKTEPLYFKGLKKLINSKRKGKIDVVDLPQIEIYGEGCSTRKLIEKTDEIISRAKILYQNVWVVFDKDDFNDFDEAIKNGKEKGYNIAWSNQSFEYWIYLHFEYSDSALHRLDWCNKLNELFKKRNLVNGRYDKNLENIYEVLDRVGGVDIAIKNAKKRMAKFKADNMKPSLYNPGTTVYLLVEDLKQYLNEAD